MSEKTLMNYRVISARNPKTGGKFLRPIVTNRNTMNMRQLVAYAKNAGYVRGQTKDLEGLLGGFTQAMQDRSLAGYSINVNDWYIISGQLKGKVGEDRQLTSANTYHVTITATKDLKASIDDFSWQRIDEGEIIKIESVTSPGGKKGEVTKAKAIVANGKRITFNSAWGDAVKVEWTDEDREAHELALTPSEVAETYLRFDWPSDLAAVAPGTVLTFVFRLHGAEGAAEQPSTLKAALIEGDVPTGPMITKVTSGSGDDADVVYKAEPVYVHGENFAATQDDTVTITKGDTDTWEWTGNNLTVVDPDGKLSLSYMSCKHNGETGTFYVGDDPCELTVSFKGSARTVQYKPARA